MFYAAFLAIWKLQRSTMSPKHRGQRNTSSASSRKSPKKLLERAYEWFLELPVPVVLGVLWLLGATLMGLLLALLYVMWTSLRVIAAA
jgi:hypothetical protein